MDQEELQALLPEELKVARRLAEQDDDGLAFAVYEQIPGADEPVRRVLEVYSGLNDTCRAEVKSRLSALAQQPLPHVARPLRVFWLNDSTVAILRDRFDECLAAYLGKLGANGRPGANRQLAEQLLVAVEALHRAGIAHGDVRPRHVFFNVREGKIQVWLSGAATGGLYAWSNGELKPGDERFFPPEWDHAQPPSPEADMYALGVLLGQANLGKRTWDESYSAHKNETVVRRAKRLASRVGGTEREALERLLQGKDRRPQASVALRELRDGARRRYLRTWATALALAALAMAAGVYFYGKNVADSELRPTIEELKGQVGALETNGADKTATIAQLETEKERLHGEIQAKNVVVAELAREIEELKKKLPPDAPKSPLPLTAEQLWERLDDTPSDEELAKLLPEERAKSEKWRRDLKALGRDAHLWREHDTELANLLGDADEAPWSELPKAQARLKDLEDARKAWRTALRECRSIDEFDKKIGGEPNPRASVILKKWRADCIRKRWTLRLTKGESPPGWGKGRWIYVNNVRRDSTWAKETAHNYPTERPFFDVTFSWKPGEPIRVLMEQDDSWGLFGNDENLIDKSFGGPLALYRLHQQGFVEEGEHRLEFVIVDCPGPPRAALKPVSLKGLPTPK